MHHRGGAEESRTARDSRRRCFARRGMHMGRFFGLIAVSLLTLFAAPARAGEVDGKTV